MTIGRIPSVEGGIQPTIVDAKGDLIAATAADTVNRLAVGDNDQVLVADSSTSTGLAWKSYGAQFVAGKNKIINGDFSINQRNFTSTTVNGVYGFDRFFTYIGGNGTTTYSAQTFTPGTAPGGGYEATNFARIASTGQSTSSSASILIQGIEDARTLAGQTVTISFWAKASSGTPSVAVELYRVPGGSAATSFPASSNVTINTTWTRYSRTITLTSLTGATFTAGNRLELLLWTSAGSDFNSRTNSLGIQTATIDFWGIQVEAGSVATPFTTATGTIQGELAACQRYYYRATGTQAYTCLSHLGSAEATTLIRFTLPVPTQMRVAPTSVDFSTLTSSRDGLNTGNALSAVTLSGYIGKDAIQLYGTVTGATQYSPYYIYTNNSAAGYIGVSAEL